MRCIETATRPRELDTRATGFLIADPPPFPLCMNGRKDEKRSERWRARDATERGIGGRGAFELGALSL